MTLNSQQKKSVIRIGGASGFWGDSSLGAQQLVAQGKLDYLVFDYLAELTMSIMAGQRLKNPDAGFALDFVTVTMRELLKPILAQGIKVISNAGGVNPHACAKLLSSVATEQGLEVKIAVIDGDDVLSWISGLDAVQRSSIRELQSGAPVPSRMLSANAYLGALPILAALAADADVVITGRCVDSAVTLGALMHAFDWSPNDYHKLASGSLAGHIIECGAQATGGLFTDWETVPDWANIGYPIVECAADGSFICTKPTDTGGLVTPAVIAEQIVYEIGDPARYLLPDVICDFSHVALKNVGHHRVAVSGARGYEPSAQYKVSATYVDGFKTSAQLTIIGVQAAQKAQRTGEALLARTRTMFTNKGLADFSATHIEVIGAESAWGPHARADFAREVVLRLTVTHTDRRALEIFTREMAAPGTSFAPGTTGGSIARPDIAPAIKQFAFLIDKGIVQPMLHVDGTQTEITSATPALSSAVHKNAIAEPIDGPIDSVRAEAIPKGVRTQSRETKVVPLIEIAHGRSGDKGNTSNIGIIARDPKWIALLKEQLTAESVASYLKFAVKGSVTRYELPGIHALNFVCEQALGGGGMASLRNDPLGKAMAQILLTMPIQISAAE
jgi:Acyclic terpene utilisation family protein AtuA